MSYILDALKKAERERAIAQVPTLMSDHDAPSEAPKRRNWLLAGACMIGLAAIIIAASALLQPGKQAVSPNADQSSSQPQIQTAPPQPVVPAKDELPDEHPPLTAAIKPVAEPERAPIPKAPAEPATAHKKPQTRAGIPQSAAAPAAQGVPESSEEQSSAVSLREAAAKMTMTIHMYSDIKSERMVFINDRKYQEGDFVEGRYLLDSITPDGALLIDKGERIVLHPRSR